MIELWWIPYTEQSIICTEKDWYIGRGIDAASHTKSVGVVVQTDVPEKEQGGGSPAFIINSLKRR
ncbi:hypothetical protein BG259_17930 [Vibrio harveyi]|nr:hypothetical protein BG259_17930 [Vibrio harveyi]